MGWAALAALDLAGIRQYRFITFENRRFVTANPQVLAGSTRANLARPLTTGAAARWRPSPIFKTLCVGIPARPMRVTVSVRRSPVGISGATRSRSIGRRSA